MVVPGPLYKWRFSTVSGDFIPARSKLLSPRSENFANVRPTKETKGFFQYHMAFDHMTYKVMNAWYILVERYA